MLIIPLQRRLGVASFPWITLSLIVINVLVYFLLQSGDDARNGAAISNYRQSGLAAIEFPPFYAHLRSRGFAEYADALTELDEPLRTTVTVRLLQQDPTFLRMLHDNEVITPGDARHADWRARRQAFERLWRTSFTERYSLSYTEPSVTRSFTHMFLHGSVDHLIGNMVFLGILGILVEAALGSGLFLAMYLLGGLFGSAVSLWRHWDTPGSMVGASGAIAALMGAFAVLWGLRQVRVFWWAFVAFGYRRVVALWLLPIWLGWQLLSLWWDSDSNVAFDAHAGGIVGGAALGYVVRRLGWERREFLDGEIKQEAEQSSFQTAMGHLGRLEFARARPLFAELAATRPGDFSVLRPWYRSWRNEPTREEFHAVARAILLKPKPSAAELAQIRETFTDYLAATSGKPRLSAEEMLALAQRFAQSGSLEEAERMLTALARRVPNLAGLADALLNLAATYRERGRANETRRVLTLVRDAFANSPQATKAAFQLEHGP